MKKLMIAAAIVCAAAISQAATATWGVSNIYKSDDATTRAAAGSYTGYFFIDSGTTARATILAMLEGSTTAAQKVAALSAAALQESTLTGSGRISTSVDFGALADGDYQGYTVIVDGNASTPAQNYVIGTDVGVAITSVGSSTIEAWNAQTVTQGGYSALAVPEPTSGLLLLLGVAGLALRRRRA